MSEQTTPFSTPLSDEPKKTALQELTEDVLKGADGLAESILIAIPEGQGKFTRKELANRFAQKLLINDLQNAVSQSITTKLDEAEKAAANAPTK